MPSEAAAGTAIEVRGLTKDYRIFAHPRDRFLQFFSRRPRHQVHHALRGVDFQVAPGEVVGILGRNGSGKSTLLEILSGVLKPTAGSFRVQGRLAALLELGAGFNPEFTGIENVRLNATILGLSNREIEARLPEILAFADIGEFAARPVKLYSSGMYVRLAFAVASSIDPDILIVDEALAVGDVQFQTKCFRRFEELVGRGRTVLLVTHSTEQVVRHCSRALLLEGGRLIADGEPRTVANRYLDLMLGTDRGTGAPAAAPEPPVAIPAAAGDTLLEQRAGYFASEYRWGNGGARLEDVRISESGDPRHRISLRSGAAVEVVLRARFQRACERAVFGLFIKTPDGVTVFGNSTRNAAVYPAPLAVVAGEEVRIAFALQLHLGPGPYLLSAGVSSEEGEEVVPLDRRYDCLHFEVLDGSGTVGLANLHALARRL
ncbi:MAG: ABC transporter ATP-binding protein [Pseudomonadota bacterium]|jgi:lipopolysaccharide transport system ATP-binding protein